MTRTADVVKPGTPFATLQASTCCAGTVTRWCRAGRPDQWTCGTCGAYTLPDLKENP